jgi:hypothetical protein
MQLSDRIGRRIILQDVHILMALVQTGSMAKTARRLNASQPNISKSIADLERVLGVRLLDRHWQGVEPTGYGSPMIFVRGACLCMSWCIMYRLSTTWIFPARLLTKVKHSICSWLGCVNRA